MLQYSSLPSCIHWGTPASLQFCKNERSPPIPGLLLATAESSAERIVITVCSVKRELRSARLNTALRPQISPAVVRFLLQKTITETPEAENGKEML